MKIQTVHDAASRDYVSRISFDALVEPAILHEVVHQIATQVAEKYVAENYITIAALIDPQAIANLVIAEAATRIREELATKLPARVDRIVEKQREVYQRGIFGGITRVL